MDEHENFVRQQGIEAERKAGPAPEYYKGRGLGQAGSLAGASTAPPTPTSPIRESFMQQGQELMGLAKALYHLENRLHPILQPAPPQTDSAKASGEPVLVVEYIASHSDLIRRIYAQVMSITERLHV